MFALDIQLYGIFRALAVQIFLFFFCPMVGQNSWFCGLIVKSLDRSKRKLPPVFLEMKYTISNLVNAANLVLVSHLCMPKHL